MDQINPKQIHIKTLIFDAIAQLLPTMGRDFDVKILFGDKNNLQINIIPKTNIGEAVKPILMKNLKEKMNELVKVNSVKGEIYDGREEGRSEDRAATGTTDGGGEREVSPNR